MTPSERSKLSCKLTTPELQQRKRTIIADLKSKLIEKSEIRDGFRYKFDGSDAMLDLLHSFVKTERLCCDFFRFSIHVSGDASFIWLELTGPEGTKAFIYEELGF
jgi:hypothetical protein